MSALITQARNRVPRFAEAAVDRARLTVVARPAQRAPRMPFVSLVSLLLVTGVAGLLLFNTHMQQASFTATSLQERAVALQAREQALQLQLDKLRNPQRLAMRAKELGMVPAPSPAFLRLSDGEVLGNPAVAQATDGIRIAPLPTRKPKDLRPAPVIVKPERSAADRSGASGREAATSAGTKSKQKSEQRQGSER